MGLTEGGVRRGRLGGETAKERGRWGQTEGKLRKLACTREEQTGTQPSKEARREQNNSCSPNPHSFIPSITKKKKKVMLSTPSSHDSDRRPRELWDKTKCRTYKGTEEIR